MNIQTALPGDQNFEHFQTLVLQAHLHHTHGEMSYWCHKPQVRVIAMAFEGERPVGAAIIGDFWPWDVGVYVKAEFRRNGIGTALLDAVSAHRKPRKPWRGDTMARGFYQQLVPAA